MNKRRGLCMTALLLTAALLFGGCGDSGGERHDAPVPSRITIEDSDNSFGARYNFTLREFTKKVSPELKEPGFELDPDQWETLSEGLVDDNGVGYSSFCNRVGELTFTAAVEDESGKVMNIGCGCASEKLKNIVFRLRLIDTAAVLAVHAGGYEPEDQQYFIGVFAALLDGGEDTLCLNHSLYIKSVDEKTTVLMTAPCSDRVISKNHYKVIADD